VVRLDEEPASDPYRRSRNRSVPHALTEADAFVTQILPLRCTDDPSAADPPATTSLTHHSAPTISAAQSDLTTRHRMLRAVLSLLCPYDPVPAGCDACICWHSGAAPPRLLVLGAVLCATGVLLHRQSLTRLRVGRQ
jgi:hypothetical protein